LEESRTFFHSPNLQELLIDLEKKGYLVFEHPKDLIDVMVDGVIKKVRKPRADIPKGFNIVAGKLSFEVSKFLDPEGVAPTLVATDVEKMMVANHDGLRSLTEREMLRLFGFPEGFQLVTKNFRESCDLMGNSIAVNVVAAVSERMLTETFS
jgi:DNA (cytosine-5)-methyltransferase 1